MKKKKKKKIFFSSVIQTEERAKGHKAQNLGWSQSQKDSFTDAAFLGEPVLIVLFIKYNTAIRR